jgi:hypothetical protein
MLEYLYIKEAYNFMPCMTFLHLKTFESVRVVYMKLKIGQKATAFKVWS